MAVGNTGEFLEFAADAMCTWLSRDGGATWEDVAPNAVSLTCCTVPACPSWALAPFSRPPPTSHAPAQEVVLAVINTLAIFSNTAGHL